MLLPLADLAPEWRHPVSGLSVRTLIEALPADQIAVLSAVEELGSKNKRSG